MKGRKSQETPYYLPSKKYPQMMPPMPMPEAAMPQGMAARPAANGSVLESKQDSARDNTMFYELRQLMVLRS